MTTPGPGLAPAAPLAIDLFCGLFGWSEGLIQEGWQVIGFDLVDMHADLGRPRRPEFRLVRQDILTLHGRQFRDATLIVASPPCQAYSYRAMPWSRAKALPPPCNALFEACFRIQREASAAAGRHIPLIVENVRGAQKWVGRARWNYGSYYLWGDVPALMPVTLRGSIRFKTATGEQWNVNRGNYTGTQPWSGSDRLANAGIKGVPHRTNGHWTNSAEHEGTKHGGDWFRDPSCPTRQGGQVRGEGRKGAGAGAEWFDQNLCQLPSNSRRRKEASALIAKIPLPLARHIAATFR